MIKQVKEGTLTEETLKLHLDATLGVNKRIDNSINNVISKITEMNMLKFIDIKESNDRKIDINFRMDILESDLKKKFGILNHFVNTKNEKRRQN